MKKGNRKTKGGMGGVLFGGLFAAVGIGFLIFSVIPTLYEGWQMRSWIPVDATVLQARLNSHRSDNSTTYNVTTQYRYSWQGQNYAGNRVGISSGSDNVGNWHQQQYQRLRSAQDNNSTLTIWLNPASPEETVVDRNIRWGLLAFKSIFVAIFGGVGITIIVLSLRKQTVTQNSSSPWQDNPAWRDNRIRSAGQGVVWFLWLFGIIWSLSMIPLWLNADKLMAEGLPVSLLPFLFPLIGIAVLIQAAIKTLRWRRFGNTVLSLSPFPGEVGGRVAGHIDLPYRLTSLTNVEVRLSCIHVYWRRSGNKSERRTEVVWQDSRRVRLEHGPQGGRINFDFRPQKGLPFSSEGSDYHEWIVEAYAKLAGPDLDKRFTIPVYGSTETTPPAEVEGSAPVTASQSSGRAMGVSADALPEWLQMGYRAGGLTLHLPMFRNLAMSIPMLIFGSIFAGIGVVLFQQSDAPWLMGVIFSLVGGVIFLGSLYSLGNSLEVVVSGRGIDLTRRVFGLPLRKSLNAGVIRKLDKKISAQSGTTAFYKVFVVDRKGGQTTIADSLSSASAADYLMMQLGRQLHIDEKGVGV